MKSFICAILLITASSLAQAQVVTNVDWELDNDQKIRITYDLNQQQNFLYFDVSVNVELNNRPFTPRALSGDVGTYIKIGKGKTIIWDVFQDTPELKGELVVEVLANNPVPVLSSNLSGEGSEENSETPSTSAGGGNVPFWVGMGGLASTGIGLLASGLGTQSEGGDLYDIYKQNVVENSEVYSELGTTRNEMYDEANKKHKTGSILAIGGGAVLATAAVIMVNRIIQINKLKKSRVTLAPVFAPLPAQANATGRYGLKLSWRLGDD
jgi:hypothetical protein